MKHISLFLLLLLANNICAKEIIVLTSALSDTHFEFRKNQYIAAFKKLIKYRKKNFYVIEALKKEGPTFLDDYTKNVFYSHANDFSLRDKGLNEGITMLDGLNHFRFNPDDMIIKLTGRYCLRSNYFLKLVRNKQKKYDAFARISGDYLHTQCFAMRYKFFKEMLESFDYRAMDENHIIIEQAIADYVKRMANSGRLRVCFVDKLYIGTDLFGSTTNPTDMHNIAEH